METLEILRNNIKTRTLEKIPNLGNIVYLVSLAIYIFSMSLRGTMLVNFLVSERGLFYLSIIPAFFVSLKIIFLDDNSFSELAIFFLLEAILFVVGSNANEFQIFYFLFFIFGAKNINIDNIVKVFIGITLLVMILSFFFAMIGGIKNVMITRADSPAVRYSFGAVYPTDLASRFVSLMMAYAVLKRFKLSLAEYISYFALTAMVYIVTDARISFLIMLLLTFSIMFYSKLAKLLAKTKVYVLNILAYGYIFLILIMGYFYSDNIWPLAKINGFLSGRLGLEKVAFKDYNVTLFGQLVPQNGSGGGFKVIDYFYIDSSYVRVLLMHGLLAFCLLLLLIYLDFKCFKQNQAYYWIICLLFMVVMSGIEQHIYEISYNFIFLATFAKLGLNKENQIEVEGK